jgi:cytochrome c556
MWTLALFLGGALLLAGCSRSPEPATGAPPPPAPRLSINLLMVTMIDNAGHVLWDAEKEQFAPKSDADWLELEDHAIQLTAAGTLIQLGGTGPADMGWIRQVDWKRSADALSDAAQAALTAAKAKDLPALVKANGDLVASCESCHKAFKPDLPTERITHQRPHSESRAR